MELVELGRSENKWELDADALRKEMYDRREELTDLFADSASEPAPTM